MSDRLLRINRLIGSTGMQVSHSTDDEILQQMDGARSQLRLQSKDSLRWCEETSRLASLAHLRSLFSLFDFSLAIDVGANVGQFATTLRSIGYTGTILSFEPNPTVLPQLEAAAKEDEDWIVIAGGVGSKEETLSLHDTDDSSFASLLPPNQASGERFGSYVETKSQHDVSIRPLQSWLEDEGLQDQTQVFLKSDTQGFDLEVLKGCGDFLSKVHAVLVELSYQSLYEGAPTHREVETFLADSGFDFSGSYPISYYPEDLRLIEADGFFVRGTKAQETTA